MVELEQVFDLIRKERQYAQGWGGNDHDKDWSLMDWLVFAEKYTAEAKLGYANYTPDFRVILIRFVKAASLLAAALQYHAQPEDLDSIAGVSSSKFPINHGGLADKIAAVGDTPCDHGDRHNCGFSKAT